MSKSVNIVHLSDLHFGHDKHHESFHCDVRAQLLEDAKSNAATLGAADAVIVTGDIAYSAQVDEYDDAGRWLEELCSAVSCEVESVYLVPGNHDVDWTKCNREVVLIHEYVHSASPQDIQSRISELYDSKGLLSKLENYRGFAERFGSGFRSIEKPIWFIALAQLSFVRLNLWGLNTALFSGPPSNESNEKGLLALGENQFIGHPPSEREVNIALMHHPLDWLQDKQSAAKYLEARALIWMMGHEHNFGFRKVENIHNQSSRVEIEAGAANPPRCPGYEFRYNWLNFSDEDHDGSIQLGIEVWPRLFNSSTRFQADEVLLGGRESMKTSLVVERMTFETQLATESGAEQIEAVIREPAEDAKLLTEENDYTESGEYVGRNDRRFRRMQFLFWTQISRTERLKVLIKLSILPEIEGEHIHMLLKNGLDVARRQSKLYALWNELSEMIISIGDEPNPFEVIPRDNNDRPA